MKRLILLGLFILAIVKASAQELTISPNIGAVWMDKSSFFDTGEVIGTSTGHNESQLYEQRNVTFGLSASYKTKERTVIAHRTRRERM